MWEMRLAGSTQATSRRPLSALLGVWALATEGFQARDGMIRFGLNEACSDGGLVWKINILNERRKHLVLFFFLLKVNVICLTELV